jgi:branched-chain amino acid transport system substrate-binding protein
MTQPTKRSNFRAAFTPCLLTIIVAFVATPVQAQDAITIGFTASKTGALSEQSLAQVRGFELWRDEVNAAGGIKAGPKRIKVEFKSHDDESQVVRVQELYGRLVTQDKVQFLFGPLSSGLNAMAAFVSEENGKVMLSAAVDPKLFRLGNRNLFQVTTPSPQSFAGALAVIKSRNPQTRIALVFKDDPFTRAVAQATRELAKVEGLTVVLDETYSPTAADFGPMIERIRTSRAEAVLGGGHLADGVALVRALREMKPAVKWLTLLAPPDATEFADLGDAALGVTSPAQWSPQVVYKPDIGPTAQVFVRRFTGKFKIAPTEQTAAGYASGLILGHAIEKAGTTEPGRVAAALNRVDLTTMFGRARFATEAKEHGLQVGHEMVLRQWQKRAGRLAPEVVWPLPAKTASPLGW